MYFETFPCIDFFLPSCYYLWHKFFCQRQLRVVEGYGSWDLSLGLGKWDLMHWDCMGFSHYWDIARFTGKFIAWNGIWIVELGFCKMLDWKIGWGLLTRTRSVHFSNASAIIAIRFLFHLLSSLFHFSSGFKKIHIIFTYNVSIPFAHSLLDSLAAKNVWYW